MIRKEKVRGGDWASLLVRDRQKGTSRPIPVTYTHICTSSPIPGQKSEVSQWPHQALRSPPIPLISPPAPFTSHPPPSSSCTGLLALFLHSLVLSTSLHLLFPSPGMFFPHKHMPHSLTSFEFLVKHLSTEGFGPLGLKSQFPSCPNLQSPFSFLAFSLSLDSSPLIYYVSRLVMVSSNQNVCCMRAGTFVCFLLAYGFMPGMRMRCTSACACAHTYTHTPVYRVP